MAFLREPVVLPGFDDTWPRMRVMWQVWVWTQERSSVVKYSFEYHRTVHVAKS